MFANGRIWLAYVIVFVASACSLVLELVAGRIMAPYIGVSLYTWTTIIGVVLAGISIGNYLGGVVADRRASRSVLGLIFVGAGLASAAVLPLVVITTTLLPAMPLIPRIVVYMTVIFFLPALIMGMVTPVVIKLALQNLERTGGTVGSIYAVSTVGSIFGTFLTGFWLISWFGTRAIVWGVAVILLAMAVVIGEYWRPFARGAALAGILLLSGAALWMNNSGILPWLPSEWVPKLAIVAAPLGVLLPVLIVLGLLVSPPVARSGATFAVVALVLVWAGWNVGTFRAPCQVESNYFCIRTTETEVDGHPVRALVLDHLVHSYVALDDPTVLGYGYERLYDELTNHYVAAHQSLDTLFIGGGGYTFPKYIEAKFPQSSIDVLEIDPAVTEAAHTFLNLPRDTRIRSFNEDARSFLIGWDDPKRYDIVYGDAFNDISVPYHLTTAEFGRIVAERLKPGGLYIANIIDKYEGGEFMKAYINGLKQVFPHVYLMAEGEAWRWAPAFTYIIVASDQPLDWQRFQQTARPGGERPVTALLPDEQLNEYLRTGRALTLTDDFAPVDQLLAPLFVERGG
ncbi:MAG: fused MFS/spermidine synthase [Chloroflexota bacterium]